MTRDKWKEIHRLARQRSRFSGFEDLCFLRDERGFMGVTKRAKQGHIVAQAAIANKLRHAVGDRGYPPSHRIFIDQVRKLRRTETWF